MGKHRRFRSLRSRLLAGVLAGVFVSSAWAARDFTPQTGTWGIVEEVDGRPGRGMAIEVQGNTFAMQVFAYEKNGDASFYVATGPLIDNTVTAPLMRYRGGRSFGSEARDGVEDGSPGNVTISFHNALQGTVQFPGEKAVAMERFLLQSSRLPLQPELDEHASGGQLRLVTIDAAGQPQDSLNASLYFNPRMEQWVLQLSKQRKLQYLDCGQESANGVFACQAQSPSEIPEANQLGVRSLTLRIAGPDVQGSMLSNHEPAQATRLVGVKLRGVASGAGIPECLPYVQIYTLGGCKGQRMPVNGTWIAEDELTGLPGRGLALDVQFGVAIVQSFHYLPDGRPSFAMAAAPLSADGASLELPLMRYRGGRYFGGPAQSGGLQESAGTLRLEFQTEELPAGGRSPDQSAGFVQYPGEQNKKIRRFSLLGDPAAPEQLLGQWMVLLTPVLGGWEAADWMPISLDHVLDGVAMTADGNLRCKPGPSGPNTLVQCEGSINKAGTALAVTGSFSLRNGEIPDQALRLRDLFGNWLGLGLKPVP